jgi:hypothetical protein
VLHCTKMTQLFSGLLRRPWLAELGFPTCHEMAMKLAQSQPLRRRFRQHHFHGFHHASFALLPSHPQGNAA